MTDPQLYRYLFVGVLMVNAFGGEVVAQTISLPQRHVGHIQELASLSPQTMVPPGDTVVWVNKDFVPHIVRVADGKGQAPVLEER